MIMAFKFRVNIKKIFKLELINEINSTGRKIRAYTSPTFNNF